MGLPHAESNNISSGKASSMTGGLTDVAEEAEGETSPGALGGGNEQVVKVSDLSYMQPNTSTAPLPSSSLSAIPSHIAPLTTPSHPAPPSSSHYVLSANDVKPGEIALSSSTLSAPMMTGGALSNVASVGSAALGTGMGSSAPGTPANDYFPFPSFRPIPNINSTESSSMNVPPPNPASAPMSRRPSDGSGTKHSQQLPVTNHSGQSVAMPDASRKSTTTIQHPHPNSNIIAHPTPQRATSATPKMLGQIGEKKSFFHKMLHLGDEKEKKYASSESGQSNGSERNVPSSKVNGGGHGLKVDLPRQVSGTSSGMPSPNTSPPRTPGSPAPSDGNSDHTYANSNAGSRAPSRNASLRGKPSNDVHAQPPTDRRPDMPPVPERKATMDRKSAGANGERSPSHGGAAPKPPSIAGDGGGKFNLKDLLSSGPKLARKSSAAGSAKGSEKGSTKGSEKGYGDRDSTASLFKKYGVCEKTAIGRGATAVVRLAHKWDRTEEKLYAVKEFRKRRKNETEKEYVKKLTSEFCISSTLHHPNIVETVDLVQDEAHHWCEVMEYCPGGDLYAAIKKGGMSVGEVECTFKQILNGVLYLHGMGVAHRDIKPENLLLDGRGHVKITDFGVSDVFRMCWEKKTHLSKGLCGSEPYIAPEQFDQKEYDARLVDIWACAIVFYCMQFQELPWRIAKNPSDTSYTAFANSFSTSLAPQPLNNLMPKECHSIIKKMLDPDPRKRIGIEEVLKDEWVMGIEVCKEGHADNGHTHEGVPFPVNRD